jgi:hypothetical protein
VSAPASIAILLLAIFATTLATLVLALGPRRRALLLLAALVSLDVALYVTQIPRPDTSRFGNLVVFAPHRVLRETMAGRPISYQINSLGFREPEFAIAKPEGVTRIVLLGDSFVFGIGVNGDETLAAQLSREVARRHPALRDEVVNLGIPGDNIASHVRLYVDAVPRLAADVVVMYLTLPNDLGHWDFQSQRHDAARVSTFSLSQYLLGEYATIALWDRALLETEVTPNGLAELDREVDRLVRARSDPSHRPPLFMLAYGTYDADVLSRLARVPRSSLVEVSMGASNVIPGDGHPNLSGNVVTARALANAFDGDAEVRAMLEPR